MKPSDKNDQRAPKVSSEVVPLGNTRNVLHVPDLDDPYYLPDRVPDDEVIGGLLFLPGQFARQERGETSLRVCETDIKNTFWFVAKWWVASLENARAPSGVAEFARWCDQDLSKSHRERRAFRRVFPQFSTPTELAFALGVDLQETRVENVPEFVFQLLELVGK
jgi:hypothetical protein